MDVGLHKLVTDRRAVSACSRERSLGRAGEANMIAAACESETSEFR